MLKLIGLSILIFGLIITAEIPSVGVILMIAGVLMTWKAES